MTALYASLLAKLESLSLTLQLISLDRVASNPKYVTCVATGSITAVHIYLFLLGLRLSMRCL